MANSHRGLLAGGLRRGIFNGEPFQGSTVVTAEPADRRHGPTPDGNGYWLVAPDGGIFSFGDAAFAGSRGGQPLNQPIVGMAPSATGRGYWLVASDGGMFACNATFHGSAGSVKLNKPVVGMARHPMAAATGWWRPTAGSSTRRRRLLRLHRRPAAEPAHRRHGSDADGAGTGWRRPTAGSSASGRPPSSAPWGASRSTNRWWASPRRPEVGSGFGGPVGVARRSATPVTLATIWTVRTSLPATGHATDPPLQLPVLPYPQVMGTRNRGTQRRAGLIPNRGRAGSTHRSAFSGTNPYFLSPISLQFRQGIPWGWGPGPRGPP